MQFLATPKETEREVKRLIGKCVRLRWAVAWASHAFPLFQLLKENEGKIDQLTVGIHFYQTHPEFIAAFMDHESVRFVMHPSGVFHPKLYLFESDKGDWDCITGSPNFTSSAFSGNCEVTVHFNNRDVGAKSAYADISSALNRFFAPPAKRLSEEDLAAYRSIWKRQQHRVNPLAGNYEPPSKKPEPQRSPLDVPLFTADWSEYFESVREDNKRTTEGRLAVLEEARRLFSKYDKFSLMSDNDRRGIAGLVTTEELDWLWFGSMKGHGLFWQAINENNKGISDALQEIPLDGDVSQADFDRYVAIFRDAFVKPGIGTATRLLALKRPDYFICLDSKNEAELCKRFRIRQNVTLENYWEKIIRFITDSNWWNSAEPVDALQKRIWKCRAAFLDVICYQPKTGKL